MNAARKNPVFHVFLIKPSKYDDDGFVIRHWRGVLPSNTMACLHGLTEDVRERGLLGKADVRVHLVDEAVSKLPQGEIVRLHRRPGHQVIAALVGVQSNQYCRAADIALALRREGVPVMIGGFHVSGMLALFDTVSPEIQELVDAGVSVVAGEVEHRWAELLEDAYAGRLKPIYRFTNDLPDLSVAPLPIVDRSYLKRFIISNYGTIDCGRGCPFNCSFCTIINVQGKKMRHRSPECIAATVRQAYAESGVSFHFFTDDNFARNPAWSRIFEELTRLREEEGIPVQFMMQVDVLSHRIPGFLEKAVRAGCSNVFIGMESVNPKNLKAASKNQNKVKDYRELIDSWHRVAVSTHVGFIIGFPYDSEQSVREDIEMLMKDVRPQRASFFMMTPLPGSMDHKRMVDAGTPLDADYNNFDSFHQCMTHPEFKDGAWTRAYFDAWRSFYSFEHMREVLAEADPKNYWDIFRNFFWYKNSALNEGLHPMISGFFPLKDRRSRRATFPQESRLAHWRRRIPETYRYLRNVARLALEMEELWLQTRKRGETEVRVLEELARMRTELRAGLRISQLRAAYASVKARMPSIEVPSRLTLLKQSLSIYGASRLRATRYDLNAYWDSLQQRLRQGRIEALLRLDRIAVNALQEFSLAAGFLVALATAPSQDASP
jgi:radical SAM superfamily enzyme YgiQ (UPF0313 family)